MQSRQWSSYLIWMLIEVKCLRLKEWKGRTVINVGFTGAKRKMVLGCHRIQNGYMLQEALKWIRRRKTRSNCPCLPDWHPLLDIIFSTIILGEEIRGFDRNHRLQVSSYRYPMNPLDQELFYRPPMTVWRMSSTFFLFVFILKEEKGWYFKVMRCRMDKATRLNVTTGCQNVLESRDSYSQNSFELGSHTRRLILLLVT